MDFLRRALRYGLAPLVFLSLLGARPPDEGVELSTSLGYRRTTRSAGCGRHAQVTEVPASVRLRARTHGGFTVHLEHEVAPAKTVPPPDEPPPDDAVGYHTYSTTITRFGFHDDRWGIEAGSIVQFRPSMDEPVPLPSVVLRYGVPDVVYAYGGVFPRPAMNPLEGILELGVGRAGDRWRGELGLTYAGARGEAEARVGRGVWVGLDGAVHAGFFTSGEPHWQGAVRLTLGPEIFEGSRAESTR